MSLRIGLIGYGEVGRIFTADLKAGGAGSVASYDILFDAADGAERRANAVGAGVDAADSIADLCHRSDVVISAVTAASSLAVATTAAQALATGQLFFDVNSVSPATKRQASERVGLAGAAYAEGAVMAAVPGPRLAVPILAGGRGAARAAEFLNPLGMNITPVADEVGRASAMKLCRSLVIKGLESVLTDCAAAAKSWDVEREVFASLTETFPSIDWAELADKMAQRVRQHGVRRAAEMREAGAMLTEMGLDPKLALAVADRQEAGAAKVR